MDNYCSKCGQKLVEHSRFCTSCGAKILTTEEGIPSQTTQQTPPQQNQMKSSQPMNQMYNQQPQNYNQYNGYQQNCMIPRNVSSKNSLALGFSIVALVLAILGSILFGIYLSIPSLVLAFVSIVMSVDVKKRSNGILGQSALVIAIIAIVFAVLFTVGYLVFDTTGYGKYGWIGGYYKAYYDYSYGLDDILRGIGF